ncbi:hypothetical protein [Deinococcus marmoris]|uniref:hypothetical protein n=1 Tax=Deinococcus marmoris TaxID=249408 RepID=UPI0004982568|nr:hypothetical protein [Deinococcus marmoris]
MSPTLPPGLCLKELRARGDGRPRLRLVTCGTLPLEHGQASLSLLSALEDALPAHVDLIEAEALSNPYFAAQVQRESINIYPR